MTIGAPMIQLAAAGLLIAFPCVAQPGKHHHRPPPPPLTLSIAFDPAGPRIPSDTPIGTLLATITVTVSDGSPFSGALGFAAPYNSDAGICAIDGKTIILGAALPPGDSVQMCTITATQ